MCSRIVNFDCTEAGLTSKWSRISPAVQWCCQQQSKLYVRQRTTLHRNLLHTHIHNTYTVTKQLIERGYPL